MTPVPELRDPVRGRIDVDDVDDLRRWMLEFDVTREDLIAAVGKVGPGAQDVQALLKHQHKHDAPSADAKPAVNAGTRR